MRNAGLNEAQAGIKIAGRNINNLRYADDTTLMAKSLQSCLTLCDPMDCSLPVSSVHGDSLGENTGIGCHAPLQGIVSYVSCIGRWLLYH